MTDQTHEPSLQSWVESANNPETGFPIQNLPFVTYQSPTADRDRLGVAIGDQILDAGSAFGVDSMKTVFAMTAATRRDLRRAVSSFLIRKQAGADALLTPSSEVRFTLPCEIGDYTDFYTSIHHAANVGSMFRPGNPLMPNFKWLPVAYHGRSSSIVVSGTPVRRPHGQTAQKPEGPPAYGPTRRLDYELELGAFVGPGNPMGQPIPPEEAMEHIAGVCLLNDWSARDIQTWEYQPLGPFLAKNFATSISPWVVTMEALEPFRRPAPARLDEDPQPLPHLQTGADDALAITLEVWLRSAKMDEPMLLSRSDFSTMYWTFPQMLAHHTSNGCPMRPGDLIGSGTVSGPDRRNRGCLLELTWRGEEPLSLPTGEIRRFLEDGDEVVLRGWCEAPGLRRISLGECRGTIV